MSSCAIGLRTHSGWAALVAVGGDPQTPEVLARRRVDIADPRLPGSKQPYHEAEEMELREAARYLARCERRSRTLARNGLQEAIDALRRAGHRPRPCVILLAAGRPLPELASILASHALIHTADGEHFRNALGAAAKECGLRVTRVRERDVAASVSEKVGIGFVDLARRVNDFRKALGPPWTQDQKLATLAGWLAL